MRAVLLLSLLPVLALAPPVAAATVEVYANDFNTPGPQPGFTGWVWTQDVEGFAGLGPVGNQFGGDLFLNDSGLGGPVASVLTLTGLPAHSSIDINFLLAFIGSWDSSDGVVAPDYFNVAVDGTTILQITAANSSGAITYAGNDIGGGLQDRGFNPSYPDRAFNMYGEPLLSVTHTGSTALIEFFSSGAGWQGGADESWGLDNLQVRVEAVPEPATMLLLACGLLAVAGARRKRA